MAQEQPRRIHLLTDCQSVGIVHGQKGLIVLRSLADLAKDTIVSKNPFPSLSGFPSSYYAAKWGLTDLYPEDEAILRNAIDNRKTFDTGWVGCKKEIRYFRLISDGKVITIQTSAEMDDFDDLIYDVMDTEVELTDDQVEELHDYWNESDIDTSTQSETTIPLTSYEDVMTIISEMEDRDEEQLREWSNVVKEWVAEVITH